MAFEKFGVKEVLDVTFYGLSGANAGKPVFYFDTLKMSNIENTAQSSSARGGKGNPKLITWDYDREATVALQDALMTNKSLALLTGNEVKTTAQSIHRRETIVSKTGGLLELSQKAIGDIFVYNADTNVEVPSTGFSTAEYSKADLVDPSKTMKATSVTVTSGKENERYEVYYRFTAKKAETVTISTDKFPGFYKIVGDTFLRSEATGADVPYQVLIHKAKLQPGFTLSFQADGDPSVFDFNIEVFKANDSTAMIELIMYEEDAPTVGGISLLNVDNFIATRGIAKTDIELAWDAVDEEGISHYEVVVVPEGESANGEAVVEVQAVGTNYILDNTDGIEPDTAYDVYIKAVDKDGNKSAQYASSLGVVTE